MQQPQCEQLIVPSLSVILIVKNESNVLSQCLESVAGIADEIVVCDTGSSDDTTAIARRHGARVHAIPWENDFAKARNASIALATGDWLLHMDADEVLDPVDAPALRAVVDGDTDADAVEVILANYCNDPRAWRWVAVPPGSPMARGYAGYLPVGLLRLFRNHRGIEYREAVHENITASVLERGGRIFYSKIVIHHYGYEVSPERRLAKARFYYTLAQEKVKSIPGDAKCLHDLAEQALACGEVEVAESACRRILAVETLHVAAATTLANICLNRGDLDEAYGLLIALEAGGLSLPHVQTALGAIAVRRGAWEEAEARLTAVRRDAPPAPMATLYLARCLDWRGKGDEALELLRALAGELPMLDEVERRIRGLELRREGERFFASGDVHGALRLFVQGLELDSEDALAHNDIGVVLHVLGDVVRACESFERALRLAPALEDARQNLDACQS
jgi:Flp pilus assembly protein TadD